MLNDKFTKKQDSIKNNSFKDSFDSSYANEIQEHLSKVNMDPWYYIYSNYVNPPSKSKKEKDFQKNE
jgi:hypothetical protein